MSVLDLSDYQAAFAQALVAGEPQHEARQGLSRLLSQPGFAVYRNTVLRGCIDALQANYPTVVRLVGEQWFRAAALLFAREHLPEHPALVEYGRGFAEFLEIFAPAAELPYLSGVAQLDRCWTEAHVAADDALLEPALLASLGAAQIATARLRPHPAARWKWFDSQPIFSIWSRNRSDEGHDGDFEWRGEGALLTRPHGEVHWTSLSASNAAFLNCCAAGGTITEAAAAALMVDPRADLASGTRQMLDAGTFAELQTDSEEELH